ncbi:MAG TPA: RsmG family class I SAM-dependent methyltransferase [Thermoanaerobaculia bacterium]|nr:RsmG family class I SAM-dependent methyltransferase [Thermoanaerobaculia bacterium]
MPFALPRLSLQSFASELAPLSPEPLSQAATDSLFAYYQELARWNEKLSLIGPGTAGEILARHFGESLAALPLLSPAARVGVDLGSGAGFPGLVIAAARPELEMTLVEARERKWAFLLAAARRASLSCRCLNARVRIPLPSGLPESLDVITSRALRLDPETWEALARRLGAGGRILLWVGENDPDLPPDLVACGGVKLAGSDRRRILVLRAA